MTAHRTRFFFIALLACVALVAAACGDDDDSGTGGSTATTASDTDGGETGGDTGETDGGDTGDGGGENTASDTGVTEDTITVAVLVADLDGLRASGFDLPESLTTDNLSSRWTKHFDRWNEEGGVNGRMIETVVATWDPTDPDSFDATCDQATIDNEVFIAMNGTGYAADRIDCFTQDADTFFFFGDAAGGAQFEGERLVTLRPPSEKMGESAAQAVIDEGLVAEGDKVGILTANAAAQKAGGEAAQSVLDDAGFETTLVEINTTQGDTGAINQEAAAAAQTFEAEGVDFVMVTLAFTQSAGFFDEAGPYGDTFEYAFIDVAASQCAQFGATRVAPQAAGAPCVTDNGTWALPGGAGIREETPEETECRELFDADFDLDSYPGVPSGDAIETSDGRTLETDFPPNECSMTILLRQALESAGSDLTHESLYEGFLELGDQPAVFRSNSNGTFGADKPWFSNEVRLVELELVGADAPLDDNGETYMGCPAPVNCWQPVGDGEWRVIEP